MTKGHEIRKNMSLALFSLILPLFSLLLIPGVSGYYIQNLNFRQISIGSVNFTQDKFPTGLKTGYLNPVYLKGFACDGDVGANPDRLWCGVNTYYATGEKNRIGIDTSAGATGHANITLYLNHSLYVNQSNNVTVQVEIIQDGTSIWLHGFYEDTYINSAPNRVFGSGPEINKTTNMGNFNASGVINRIVLVFDHGVSPIRGFINEINFTYVSDVTGNMLPSFNVSVNDDKYVCFNDTETSRSVTVEINVSDPENDVVYYGTNVQTGEVNKAIVFSKQSCLLGYCITWPDYSFIEDYIVYPYGDSCIINQDSDNLTAIQSSYNLFYTSIGEDEWYSLSLSQNCTGDRNLFFSLDTPTPYFYLQLFNPGFGSSTGTMNLSLYNQYFDEILRVKFVKDGTRLLSYSMNTTNTPILVYNSTPPDFSIYQIVIDNKYNITTTVKNYTLIVGAGGERADLYYIDSSLSDKKVKYFAFDTAKDNTDFRVRSLRYIAQATSPVFTTSKPTNVTVFNYPTNQYDFYVTDNIHLGSSYASLQVNIPTFQGCQEGEKIPGTSESFDEVTENKDFLALLKLLIGFNMKQLFITIGVYEVGKTIMYWFWLGLFIILVAGEYTITRKFDVTVPLFISSFFCLIMSYLIGYIGNAVVFLIFTALSLMGVVSSLFLGGHHGL